VRTLDYWLVGQILGLDKIFKKELCAENEMLGKAVASLNTMMERKANVNILEMEEEEESPE
jgi:hypothetical protein